MNIHVHSPKGGSGVSTVAAALAVLASRQRVTTLWTCDTDTFTIMGKPVPEPGETITTEGSNALVLAHKQPLPSDIHNPHAVHVIDLGTWRTCNIVPDLSIMVIRNCYLALNAARRHVDAGNHVDVTVFIEEPDRALTINDAKEILPGPVVKMAHSMATARAVDAGLIGINVPGPHLAKPLNSILFQMVPNWRLVTAD